MISENKLKHSIGVARNCYNIAISLGLSEDDAKASFVMGLLHDIGYEQCGVCGHAKVSGEYIDKFLKNGYAINNAISTHGDGKSCYSIWHKILNTADLTTSYLGEAVSAQERIDGIKDFHGKDSKQYKNAVKMANLLGLKYDEH